MSQPPSLRRASLIVASLIALGVQDIVTCPGSRNAPLLYVAAAAEAAGLVRLHPRSDERSAAFVALGLSLGSGHSPVAVTTTSGTAVANLHPAMLEAAYAGVPIVALTADRTAAQRAGGANQSVRQSGIFGPDIETTFIDIEAAEFDASDALRDRLGAAAGVATGVGPIHLNVEFAEPLVPATGGEPDSGRGIDPIADLTALLRRDLAAITARWRAAEASTAAEPSDADASRHLGLGADDRAALDVTGTDRTLVVAGSGADPRVAELCVAQGWPLIAEIVAGAGPGPHRVTDYRRMLDEGLAGASGAAPGSLVDAVEQVIVFGRPTLSRQVSRLIAETPGRVIAVGQQPGGISRVFDPALRADAKYRALPHEWLAPAPMSPRRSSWLRAWTSAPVTDRGGDVAAVVTVPDPGAAAVRQVLAAAQAGDAIVLGPSRVVRHADQCEVADGVTVYSNRGVSGIDGVVSTAIGVALTDRFGSVRAVMGDLTFLHDMGGLQLGRGVRQPNLQIVVVNDDGGTIFSTLEHGEVARRHPAARDVVAQLLTTPASADIELLCQAMGVRHSRDLARELANPLPGVTVIEVSADAPFS
ncbi:2-succinyl-5-enolpyruvyl-6-hydroxy-3-cyclohexene- 1-carboxylic-acid synthase [Rarobacter faecitabidus]|uniref:2-succinyl-5-enolpyruvyl-6-hydroxy-3- cyclohexene-1-carboxylic-acid synthase n=1 Tax=Rarobacter faecitabidus TaxID=13243 RepID=UPI001477285D|nr:2-succinyl-5-enolpyruvyl-6-hydroxy-3-cyclohexene-1-carboxylic-acid synthase [Rarobacter faecitabidus]